MASWIAPDILCRLWQLRCCVSWHWREGQIDAASRLASIASHGFPTICLLILACHLRIYLIHLSVFLVTNPQIEKTYELHVSHPFKIPTMLPALLTTSISRVVPPLWSSLFTRGSGWCWCRALRILLKDFSSHFHAFYYCGLFCFHAYTAAA